MAHYLVPIVPNIYPIPWVLTTCALVFITAALHRIIVGGKTKKVANRDKRRLKYEKRSIRDYVATGLLIGVIIAFFLSVFPVYPVVILTGSMSGTFERGSLVFVQRVPPGEAFDRVGENYVIHFLSRGRVSYVHRVIDFRHDEHGERQYITQGDASYLIDTYPVPQEDVLGIARASLPLLGYPYVMFQSILRALSLR